jgi:hypothetical protein
MLTALVPPSASAQAEVAQIEPAITRAHYGNSNDAVMEWNLLALGATVTAGAGPVPQVRFMTIVQMAMNDAVNGISRRYKTYLPTPPAPHGASSEAAAIAAAHKALTQLFPAQVTSLNMARTASLAALGLSEADPGIAYGEARATAILALRANDGAAQASFPYTAPGAGNPGVWVAVGSAAPVVPGWGKVDPWVMWSGSQFRPLPPLALSSRRYARDYNEILEIGRLDSTTRTEEQTEIARFWLASPTIIWNGVARQIIEARNLDDSETARTFALMYVASADASIACWDAKYTYNFWRPITAIHNGDQDSNDRTLVDTSWAPLFPTPQHPEYLSGHSTNSSAMANILALLFSDHPGVTIVATSTTNPGFERHWARFSEGVDEVVEARIYSGIHFRTADERGARVGERIARLVYHSVLGSRRGHGKR